MSKYRDVKQVLEDASGASILNMNASWTSKWYPMAEFKDLGWHLVWDSVAPTGNLFLEYTWDVGAAIGQADVIGTEIKDTVALDGSFQSQAFLDANVAITGFRLRFAHTGGAANITLSSRVRSR